MSLTLFKNTLIITLLSLFSCGNRTSSSAQEQAFNIEEKQKLGESYDTSNYDDIWRYQNSTKNKLTVGADQHEEYLPLLQNKKVGVVANQTSWMKTEYKEGGKIADGDPDQKHYWIEYHLVDFLKKKNITVKNVFAPEHGFRGTADAGEVVKDGIDVKTGIPIISLYGKNKKPTQEQLADIDVMVFDIQDVGARFYTYISTLHYVMEACAEAGIPIIVMDRPNPNGHYIDGPILEPEHSSFVGMHPVPVVHGMTIGEYAQMINGQRWLKDGIPCELIVIKMKHYTHQTPYVLPIKPSPNLPNATAINLYPSLCFFEGTIVSAGRGTDMQFQIFGAPSLPKKYFPFEFTPQANEGAKFPKFKGERCYGLDLSNEAIKDKLNLEWLIEAYVGYGKKPDFFNSFFTKLAGTEKLQKQIETGYTYPEIRTTWLRDLDAYNKMRQAYLLYE